MNKSSRHEDFIVIFAFLLMVLIGAWVYSGISVWAALRYLAVSAEAAPANEPISVLKPLSGLDEGLEQNLRSFFDQSYSAFELIFAVRDAADPCVPYVRQLCAEYPRIPSRLILTGEPPYPHAKVYSLACMLQASAYDLIVMSDSDIRVEADFLSRIAGEFASGEIALATCPYRAVAGASAWPGGVWSGTFWSSLEALGMNTTFWQGVLTARLLDGMKFAIGPTIVARKKAIDAIGGIESVHSYLAEDFELGRAVARSGARVILSAHRVEHRIGSEGLARNFAHRLRWARTGRRSRPAGYIGQMFTYPVPLALLLCALSPAWWPILVATLLIRSGSAWITAHYVLAARVNFLLLPVEDVLAFAFWIAGFFGNTIAWRGRTYRVDRQGRAVGLADG